MKFFANNVKLMVGLMSIICSILSFATPSLAAPGNNTPRPRPSVNNPNLHQAPPVGLHQTPHARMGQAVTIPGIGLVSPGDINAGITLLNNPAFQQISTLLPALLSSVSFDANQGVAPGVIDEARKSLDQANTPAIVKQEGNAMLDFLYKNDPHAGLFSPRLNQRVQQFTTPAVGKGCMQNGNSIGMALATAGPQRSPAPGPRDGEVGFVFTSLGTGPAVFDSSHPLSVQWVNLETHRNGKVVLAPNRLINFNKGPGTFTAIVPTGHGRIVATISGTVTTRSLAGHDNISCQISPTLGLIRA